MRLSLLLAAPSVLLLACHRSSGVSASPSPVLLLGINDLGEAERLLAYEDGVVAAALTETSHDLDGDGDRLDSLLEVLDLRSGARRFVPDVALERGARTGAGFVSFLVSELDAARDLNADGDVHDLVAHVHDARTGATRNLGLAASAPLQEDALVAFAVPEEPGVDLNGDGDFRDLVAHAYDAERSRLTPLTATPSADTLVIRDRRLLYIADQKPTVQIFDADTRALRSLPHAVDGLWVEGALLATLVAEWKNGGHDLNGNGRNNDLLVELHDLDTGRARVTDRNLGAVIRVGGDLAVVGLADPPDVDELRIYDRFSDTLSDPIGLYSSFGGPPVPLMSDRRHAYLVNEHEHGVDLDDDGRQESNVLHLFDARTVRTRSTGLAAFSTPQIDAQRVVFLGRAEPGPEPVYISLHTLDVHSNVVTDLVVRAHEFRLVDGRVVASTPESWQGLDLDGDGELDDYVLQVLDLATGETFNTTMPVEHLDETRPPVLLDGDVVALVLGGRLKAYRLR